MSARFQSTPPTRGATATSKASVLDLWFQSTPPTRGATAHNAAFDKEIIVSIHAPHAGSDDDYVETIF